MHAELTITHDAGNPLDALEAALPALDLKRACESIWRSFRGSSGLKPKLESLELIDEATTQVMASASVGVFPQAKRTELWLPILVALATVGVAAASEFDGATVAGALASWIAGALALLVLVVDVTRRKLVWQG